MSDELPDLTKYEVPRPGKRKDDDAALAEAIKAGADELQIDPIDYATAMSYESGGTFDPWKAGPTTKWGLHRGTIQYGEPQRKQYGVYEGQSAAEQITKSNVKYLKDRGVKPGMKFEQIYAAINGGNVNRDLSTKDVGTPRTIRDNIRKANDEHRPQVLKRFGQYFGQNLPDLSQYEVQQDEIPDLSQYEVADAPQQPGVTPGVSPTLANPTIQPKTSAPVTEAPETLEAQRRAAMDPASSRAAVLYTDASTAPELSPGEYDITLPNNQLLRANASKLMTYLQSTGTKIGDLMKGTADFTPLIGGKAEPTGEQYGTQGDIAVISYDENGNELVASAITDPASIAVEAALHKKQYPNQKITTTIVTGADVVAGRQKKTEAAPAATAPQPGLGVDPQKAFMTGDTTGALVPDSIAKDPQQVEVERKYSDWAERNGKPKTAETAKEFNQYQEAEVAQQNEKKKAEFLQKVPDFAKFLDGSKLPFSDASFELYAQTKKAEQAAAARAKSPALAKFLDENHLEYNQESIDKYNAYAKTENAKQQQQGGDDDVIRVETKLNDKTGKYDQTDEYTDINGNVLGSEMRFSVDPRSSAIADPNEAVWDQAMQQFGQQVLGRQLSKLEMGILADLQKKKGGFTLDRKTDKPVDVGDAKEYFIQDPAGLKKTIQDLQPGLARYREQMLSRYIGTGLPMEAKDYADFLAMGFTTEELRGAYIDDPSYATFRDLGETNRERMKVQTAKYMADAEYNPTGSTTLAEMAAARDLGLVTPEKVNELRNAELDAYKQQQDAANGELRPTYAAPGFLANFTYAIDAVKHYWPDLKVAADDVGTAIANPPIAALWGGLPDEFKVKSFDSREVAKARREMVDASSRSLAAQFGTLAGYQKYMAAQEYTAGRGLEQLGRTGLEFVGSLVKTLPVLDRFVEDWNSKWLGMGYVIPEDYMPSLRSAGNLMRYLGGSLTGTYDSAKDFEKADLPIDQSKMFALGEWVSKRLGEDPYMQNSSAGQITSAIGSGLTFLVGGGLLRGVKYGAGILGAASQIGSTYEDLRRAGVSDKDAGTWAVILGTPLGFSEEWGLGGTAERALAKLGAEAGEEGAKVIAQSMLQFTKSAAKKVGRQAIEGVFREAPEEFLQEWFQSSFGQAAIAAIAAKDKNAGQKIQKFFEGIPRALVDSVPQGLYAALSGGALGGGSHSLVAGLNIAGNTSYQPGRKAPSLSEILQLDREAGQYEDVIKRLADEGIKTVPAGMRTKGLVSNKDIDRQRFEALGYLPAEIEQIPAADRGLVLRNKIDPDTYFSIHNEAVKSQNDGWLDRNRSSAFWKPIIKAAAIDKPGTNVADITTEAERDALTAAGLIGKDDVLTPRGEEFRAAFATRSAELKAGAKPVAQSQGSTESPSAQETADNSVSELSTDEAVPSDTQLGTKRPNRMGLTPVASGQKLADNVPAGFVTAYDKDGTEWEIIEDRGDKGFLVGDVNGAQKVWPLRKFDKQAVAEVRVKLEEGGLKSVPGENKETRTVAQFDNSLGIPRAEMPQIRGRDQAEFREFARSKGFEIKEETVKASSLLPTQSEYNPTNASGIPAEFLKKPLMVSSDNRVLDGHNTLVRLLENPDADVTILRVPATATKALELMNSFEKVGRKRVDDVGSTDDVEKAKKPETYFNESPKDESEKTYRTVPIEKLVDLKKSTPAALGRARQYAQDLKTGEPGAKKRDAITVTDNGNGTYSVVDGHSAIAALRDEGVTEFPVKIISGELPETFEFEGITHVIEPIPEGRIGKRLFDLQKQTTLAVLENPDHWIKRYLSEISDKVLNVDDARDLFDDYLEDPLSSTQGVHEAASLVVKMVLNRKLKELPPESKVLLTAGGASAGKTFSVKQDIAAADLVFDGVMKDEKGNRRSIDQILNAGHVPFIRYIYRDIAKAAKASVARWLDEKRVVPISVFAAGHVKSAQAFLKDTIQYAESKGVKVQVIYNDESGAAKAVSVAEFRELAYNDIGEAERLVREAAYNEYESDQQKYFDDRLPTALEGAAVPYRPGFNPRRRGSDNANDDRQHQSQQSQGPGASRAQGQINQADIDAKLGAGRQSVDHALPPKETPIVLVFGGAFNPMHTGHLGAAEDAKAYLEGQGYTVEKIVVAPTPQKLLEKKFGDDEKSNAAPLETRAAIARSTVGNRSDVEVVTGAAREAEASTTKPKRTQTADWVAYANPGRTVVNITGADATVEGAPSSFPALYDGADGTSHEGYYYLTMPRDEAGGMSSSKVRAQLKESNTTPEGSMTPEAEAIYREHLEGSPLKKVDPTALPAVTGSALSVYNEPKPSKPVGPENVAKTLQANMTRALTKPIEDATSKEIEDAFYRGAKADLEYWVPRNLSDYTSFYPDGSGQDDVTVANQKVSDWYQTTYGKPIKPEQLEMFHLLSSLSAANERPRSDAALGMLEFEHYLRTGTVAPLDPAFPRPEFAMNPATGKKEDTGNIRFAIDEDTGKSLPDMPQWSKNVGPGAFRALNRVLGHFNGDLKATMDWLKTVHPYQELLDVSGQKAIGIHEYLSEGNGGEGVFSLFSSDAPKLGSYYLARLGKLDKVVKDMWYGRGEARYLGLPLGTIDKKTGKFLIVGKPLGPTSVARRRARVAEDAAIARLAKEYKVQPGIIQQWLWDAEQQLWLHAGMKGEEPSYISQGVQDGIDRLNVRTAAPARSVATIGLGVVREGTGPNIRTIEQRFTEQQYLDTLSTWHGIVKAFNAVIPANLKRVGTFNVHLVQNTVGIWEGTSGSMEESALWTVSGPADLVRAFAVTASILAPNPQQAVMLDTYDRNGSGDETHITFKDRATVERFVAERDKYGAGNMSLHPTTETVILVHNPEYPVDLEGIARDYAQDITDTETRGVDTEFIEETEYRRHLQEARDSVARYYPGKRGQSISKVLDEAEARLRKEKPGLYNEEVGLKKVKTEQSRQLRQKLEVVEEPELVRRAGRSVLHANGELEVTEADAELLRRLVAERYFRRMGKEIDEQPFDGITWSTNLMRNLAYFGRVELRPTLLDLGYTDDMLAGYDALMRMLDEAADANEGYAVVYVYDTALPHERTHKEDLTAGRTPADVQAALLALPIAQTKGTDFDRAYPGISAADKVSELAAIFANGEAAMYGLSLDKAAQREFLRMWANGIIDNNKAEIDAIGFDAWAAQYPIITGIAMAMQEGELNATNNQSTEDSTESDTAAEGPGAVPGGSVQGTSQGPQGTAQASAGTQTDQAAGDNEVAQGVATDAEIAEATGRTVGEVKTQNRQFARTLAANLFDIGDVEYSPQTVEGWQKYASEVIEEQGLDAAIDEYRKMPANASEGRKTALGVAIAVELYTQGRTSDLTTFGIELTENIGNAAQELRAAALMARLSPAFASITGDKIVRKAKGRAMNEAEREKIDKLARELEEAADAHAFARAALAEAQGLNAKLDERVKELEKMLADEKRREGGANVANLQAALDAAVAKADEYAKQLAAKPNKPKGPKALRETREKLNTEIPDALAFLQAQFPEISLKSTSHNLGNPLGSGRPGQSDLVRAVPTANDKRRSDLLRRRANELSNLLVSQAGIAQPFGKLDVVTRRAVFAVMDGLLQDLQVADTVVRLVPIAVMNVLGGKKVAPEMLRHNPAMLVNLLPSNPENLVPGSIQAMNELASAVARAAAIVAAQLRGLNVATGDRGIARGTVSHIPGKVPSPSENVNDRDVAIESVLKQVSMPDAPLDVDGFDRAAFAKERDSIPLVQDKAGKLLAPNGKVSKIQNKDLWRTVRTKAFIEFFGDWQDDPENASKAVDGNGEPLILYHGSPTGDREAFDVHRSGSVSDSGWLGKGIYLTDHAPMAGQYATFTQDPSLDNKGAVYPLFLNLRSPFGWGKKTTGTNGLVFGGTKLPATIHDKVVARTNFKLDVTRPIRDQYADADRLSAAVSDVLSEEGFDGIVARDEGGFLTTKEFVAFEPTQVKSIFNRGSFDANEGAILKKVDPQTQTPEFKRWFGDSKVVDENGNPARLYHLTEADFDTFRPRRLGAHFGSADAANERGPGRINAATKTKPTVMRRVRESSEPLPAGLEARHEDGTWSLWQTGGRFGEYRLNLGGHSTSEEAAKAAYFQAHPEILPEGGRLVPVYLSLQNPVKLTDPGNDEPERMAGHLLDAGVFTPEEYGSISERVGQGNKQIRDLLLAKGYDGGYYINEVEGAGSVSWVAFKPTQIKSAIGNNGQWSPDEGSILKQTIPDDLSVSPETVDALVKVAAAKLIDELPTGWTPQQFDKWLTDVTNGKLGPRELAVVHALAYDMTRPAYSPQDAEQKALAKNRLAHRQRADRIMLAEGMTDVTDEGIEAYQEAHKKQGPKKSEAQWGPKAGPKKPGSFVDSLLDLADELDANEETVLMALAIRETPDEKKLRALYNAKFPEGGQKGYAAAMNAGKSLLDMAKDQATQEKWQAKAGRDATTKQVLDLQRAIKEMATEERLKRKALEQQFRLLVKTTKDEILGTISSIYNLPRSVMFAGDLGFLLAQGAPTLLMHPSAWWKAVSNGVPAVLTDKRFEEAVTKFYNEEMRKRLEAGGVKFEQIGNIADFNDDFMSDIARHIPIVKQTNLAHSLTTDLFRLYGGGADLAELDAMYEAGKLGKDAEENAFNYNRSKEFLTKKWVNVMSGKGYLGMLSPLGKPMAQVGSAPRYTVSAFQIPYYANPLRAAFLPKGARKIMMKNSAKLWVPIAALMAFLSWMGWINDDPEDKDFLQINMDKILGIQDMKLNPLRALKEPLRLMLGLPLKMAYYAMTGNKEGVDRISKAYYAMMVMDSYGQLGSFWKSKLHPTISTGIQIGTGKNFVGEPLGWMDVLPLPLPIKEGYQAWGYDHKQSILKSGADSGTIKDNWQRFAATMIGSMIGFGANSYPASDTTVAGKQLLSMMDPDTRPQVEKDQSAKANQLERLIREGVDVSEELKAALTTNQITKKQAEGLARTLADDLGDVEARFGTKFTDAEKVTLLNNRKALKILDYLYKGFDVDWAKIDRALPFATKAENTLNGRAALAEAEAIVLEAVLRGTRLTKQMATDDMVEMYKAREGKMTQADRDQMLKMIETKARNANKGRTLSPDEYERIKTVLPDLKIDLRPPKVKP